MKIYISIPISGLDFDTQREKADLIKAKLSREGHTVVSPFDIYAGKNPTYADYICYDLRAMMDCDAVCFCKGWESSCGCQIEYHVAMRFKAHEKKNFKLFYDPSVVPPSRGMGEQTGNKNASV